MLRALSDDEDPRASRRLRAISSTKFFVLGVFTLMNRKRIPGVRKRSKR